MAVASKLNAVFELKSAALTLVAVVLKTTDLTELSQAFEDRFGDGGVFDNDPVAIDLGALRASAEPIDFAALIALLRRYSMQPVAVKNGSAEQLEAAFAAGLHEAAESAAPVARNEPAMPAPAPAPAAPKVAEVVLTEVIREVPVQAAATKTMVIDKPQRYLYVILPNVTAVRYGIALGSSCADAVGRYVIARKLATSGSHRASAIDDASGQQALYFDTDTQRIHDTDLAGSIGRAVRNGCFQLIERDFAELYGRIPVGTRVVVN